MVNDEVLLNVEGLKVVYQNVSIAIEGVSLEVKKNQIVTLLGSNGAGKTTTLRAISWFLGLDNAEVVEGIIEFEGERIQNRYPDEITKKGIVLTPEREKVFESLTVEENLQVCVSPTGDGKKRKDLYSMIFDFFPLLGTLKNRLAGYLSGGERQMLALSMGLLCGPKLLLIDELSLGLAPLIIDGLMNFVKVIRDQQGVSVLLVEQNALAALKVADYGYLMENGRVVLTGETERLRNHDGIRDIYLGLRDGQSRKSYRDVKQHRGTRRWYG